MEESLARALFEAGVGHCGTVIQTHGGLLVAMLTTGLLGSLSHCTGMCGAFVISQVSARLETVSASRLTEHHRWSAALLIPYHLGRVTTYTGLGALTAAITAGVEAVPGFRWLGAALLGVAALGFLLSAVERWSGRRLLPSVPTLDGRLPDGWGRLVRRASRPLLETRSGSPAWRSFRLGLVLGFIPCGLVYGALAIAAASGDSWTGALAMAAFAFGTVPALIGVGLAGHLAGRAYPALVAHLLPPLMIINSGTLAWLAWRVIGV
ncbi:MAG: sulfite exporter TauE/SafE family protein [Rhodospirillaceae bacterium]